MFSNKNVLVIGGTGSIGKELVKTLIRMNPKVIRIFSRDERKQYQFEQEIRNGFFFQEDEELPTFKNVRFLIGDVRDRERVMKAMERIDVVFNLAAMKHVPSCEYNPFEAVKSNVIGTQNVIECAIERDVETVVYTSTDKAASPTSTMGATKLLAERLMSSAGLSKGNKRTKFLSVRFGNVLMSSGSVLPLFIRQAKLGKDITVTDPNMTRFVITVSEAINLILKAYKYSVGGEIFVLKMPVVSVGDLAKAVNEINGFSSKIKVIGKRPGEKLYEEIMTEEESMRAIELSDMYSILPYQSKMGFYMERYEDSQTRRADVHNYSSNDFEPLRYEETLKIVKKAIGGEEI